MLRHVVGRLFAVGFLLWWVGVKLFREIHPPKVVAPVDDPDTPAIEGGKTAKSFARAAIQVAVADLSMSLDNVLEVAGAARDHPTVLFFGLAVSVTMMEVRTEELRVGKECGRTCKSRGAAITLKRKRKKRKK